MTSKKDFRIIFMGTPEFAVESLNRLVTNGFNIVAVVTSPDKPSGRGQHLSYSAIKTYALSKNLKILQPEKLKDEAFQAELKQLNADLQIIVAFRMLPQSVWSMPRLGSINLHASLLPEYRGAAPINWAIINGETKTGITTFFLKHEIDTGDILFQEVVPIEPEDNAGTIHDKLMIRGAHLLQKTVEVIIEGGYTEVPQNLLRTIEIKHAPKIFKEDCKIDWSMPLNAIHNKVRGLSPYPAAWSNFIDETGEVRSFKIFQTNFEFNPHELPFGTVISDKKEYLKIAVPGGFLWIQNIQIAGKKRMSIQEYLKGHKEVVKMRAI